MATVVWYSLGGQELSEREMEDEARRRIEARATSRRLFGLLPPRAG